MFIVFMLIVHVNCLNIYMFLCFYIYENIAVIGDNSTFIWLLLTITVHWFGCYWQWYSFRPPWSDYCNCFQRLYSLYLLPGSPLDIECRVNLIDAVYDNLNSPDDVLFGDVEKFVLRLLFCAWSEVILAESESCEQVCDVCLA